MASNIPTEAQDIHNALVLHLREHIVDDELQKLKQLFRDNPLTRRDIASINDIYGLFECLMREEKIDVGNYDQLVQKLQQTNPNLVGYVKEKEKKIKNLLDGDTTKAKIKNEKVYKPSMLKGACKSGAEERALYLLCEEPDEETVFLVVEEGSIELLHKLLEYDVTPTARGGYSNGNVLHEACERKREEMVTLLCDTYPHLVLDTDDVFGQTPLHVVARTGNFGLFKMVERIVLNSIYRVENQQTKCESVDGCVVHKYCVCAQYMSQLVGKYGLSVLHHSCCRLGEVNREVCLYLCRSYPGLIQIVDVGGRHFLHYIAGCTSDVDLFTECETYVKKYVESTGGKYDVTTILTNRGKSVLNEAKSWGSEGNPLLEHLAKVFGK